MRRVVPRTGQLFSSPIKKFYFRKEALLKIAPKLASLAQNSHIASLSLKNFLEGGNEIIKG